MNHKQIWSHKDTFPWSSKLIYSFIILMYLFEVAIGHNGIPRNYSMFKSYSVMTPRRNVILALIVAIGR